jgi:ubiquinone/menaquinone biosynthesis C-methylase UbiE
MQRIDAPELLDEDNAPRRDVERSLRDLRRFNRWLGGLRVYRKLLTRATTDRNAPLRVADLGAGTADCLESVRHDYPNVTAIAFDFNIVHLRYRHNGSRVYRVVADAEHLPLRDGAVDVVTSAHFFHHFSPEQNAVILRDSLRAAKRAVIVNDTRRHRIPLLVTLLLGWLRLVGRITRYDAPASIRRGYTDKEARAIAANTGAARVETVRVWPYRFGLILWRAAAIPSLLDSNKVAARPPHSG